MDKEALRTCAKYSELCQNEADNYGVFASDAVKQRLEQIEELSEDEKLAFYIDAFADVVACITAISGHERFKPHRISDLNKNGNINLEEEGLGTIWMDVGEIEPASIYNPFTLVRVELNNPHGDTHRRSHTLHKDTEGGRYYNDGSDSGVPTSLSHAIRELLDTQETLCVIKEALGV